jgi:hypothetical protein
MLGEIPYMIVWGFFSAMGWMGASWTVDKVTPEKEKVMICKKQESDNLICKEELKTSAEAK